MLEETYILLNRLILLVLNLDINMENIKKYYRIIKDNPH